MIIVFPGDQIKTLEKVALGIFLSVMISIAVGVMLGLGTFFQASNSIIILTVYVVLADVAASYRAYDFLRKSRWLVLPKT
jgi:CDP-diglyceride synthetase